MDERSPIVSECATEEKEAAYTEWLKAKVAASLADPPPAIPRDEAMARIRAVLHRKRGRGESC